MANLHIIIGGQERNLNLEDYGLSYESDPDAILEVANGIVQEDLGVDLKDEQGNWIASVQKVEESQKVYVIPKSPAGN